MREKILIADDEKDIVIMLKDYFEINGYDVLTALCGREAILKASMKPDIILLDINMPDMDGIEVCQSIREFVACPIIFLTARIEESDKIIGFGAGGDDYVVKPFSLNVLGARVAAHLRREKRKQRSDTVKFDVDLAIDYSSRQLYYKGQVLALRPKEFDIIELLSINAGQVFDKERIYESVWGLESDGDSQVVTEHIRRIRARFAEAGLKSYVETVWGVGYRWQK